MTARWNNLPVRCKCCHGVSAHTGGSGMCWTRPCACRSFRDSTEPKKPPAPGFELPHTADTTEYLRAKGEIA